jgi:hypothetical protein
VRRHVDITQFHDEVCGIEALVGRQRNGLRLRGAQSYRVQPAIRHGQKPGFVRHEPRGRCDSPSGCGRCSKAWPRCLSRGTHGWSVGTRVSRYENSYLGRSSVLRMIHPSAQLPTHGITKWPNPLSEYNSTSGTHRDASFGWRAALAFDSLRSYSTHIIRTANWFDWFVR